jgi:hypothetical protein
MTINEIIKHKDVNKELQRIEDKILERGLLTEAVGRNDFVISLKLGIDNSSDEDTLKVICNFEEEVPPINFNADQCDDIQDAILDYLSEKCFDELLVKCGLTQDESELNYVHISIDGKFIFS